jgi:hypothetical protein
LDRRQSGPSRSNSAQPRSAKRASSFGLADLRIRSRAAEAATDVKRLPEDGVNSDLSSEAQGILRMLVEFGRLRTLNSVMLEIVSAGLGEMRDGQLEINQSGREAVKLIREASEKREPSK